MALRFGSGADRSPARPAGHIYARFVRGARLGALAGIAGTGAMMASGKLGRPRGGPDGDPLLADATCTLLGVPLPARRDRERLEVLLWWFYGSGWGSVRGLLAAAGLAPLPATAIHFATGWAKKVLTLSLLEVEPVPARWGPRRLAQDAAYHLVYAAGTGAVYTLLDHRGQHHRPR